MNALLGNLGWTCKIYATQVCRALFLSRWPSISFIANTIQALGDIFGAEFLLLPRVYWHIFPTLSAGVASYDNGHVAECDLLGTV